MKRRIPAVLVISLILLVSGCLGSKNLPETVTITKTLSETVTVTKTETHVERDSSLEKNLSECLRNYTLLNESLEKTLERLKTVEDKYEECLIERSLLKNSSEELRVCLSEKENLEEQLQEKESELVECQKELSSLKAAVMLLPDDEYYWEVLKTIKNANESVYVMMFSMLYDPDDSFDWANSLIRALVEAQRRGIKVHVLLENSLDSNREAYNYLKSHGVDVSYDSPATTLHAKVVVVDGKIVFIGSHNWSESALYWNREVSVKIISEDFAKRLIEYFERVRENA